jgi:cytochrome P450
MARELPSASLIENARFNALVIVPNAIQGIFRRRRTAVAAATMAGVDRWAVGLVEGMRRSYGPGPVWVRVIKDPALLVLSREDIERVLGGSPDPFAPDPEAKRRGMAHFQPHALTISRGELWAKRRRFAEAVLDTPEPVHRLGDRFVAVAEEEADTLLRQARDEGGELEWDPFNLALRRITRRVVFGDGAADDEELSELLGKLMDEANGLPKEQSERFEPFMAKVEAHVGAAEPGSLAGLFADAQSDGETKVAGQVPHWLFATGDTLAINAFRALALIASHPSQRERVEAELERARGNGALSAVAVGGMDYLGACLHEAMRLWPTTPMLSRETLADIEWDGAVVPAGTQVLIFNVFHHRDRESHEFADRFAPEAWIEGDAGGDWSFNHFSHGPQGCPGTSLALLIGKATLATLLSRATFRLTAPKLDPQRPLPHMVDYFGIRFAVER